MKKLRYAIAVILTVTICIFIFSACDYSEKGFYWDDDFASSSPEADNANDYGITENPVISTDVQNDINFSVDVHTANYSLFKNMILDEESNYSLYPKTLAAYAQIDQMLNYFDYGYETPEGDVPLSMTASIFDCNYNPNKKLMTVGLASKEIAIESKVNNLVILLDVSGSMMSQTKLALAKKSIILMLENLTQNDRISLVTYAGSAETIFEDLPANDSRIPKMINSLSADGMTNGSGGIQLAYDIAKKCYIEEGNNRVIIMTDGDFNVGISNAEDLKEFISEKRDDGIYLSCIGFGESYNYSVTTMEVLAKNGNGNWGYIHTMDDAQKLLVEELGSTIVTIVKDVKSKMQFNSDIVKNFRLLGYENNILSDEEFEESSTDAGEIGSGFNLTICFEIELREGVDLETADQEVAKVNMKYKLPEDSVDSPSKDLILPVNSSCYTKDLSDNDIFIGSVVEFALIAIDSAYKGEASIDNVISRLQSLSLEDKYKLEFLQVVTSYKRLFMS